MGPWRERAARYLQTDTQLLLPRSRAVKAEGGGGAHRGLLWTLIGPGNHKLNSVF